MTLLNSSGAVRVENGTWNNYDWDNGGNALTSCMLLYVIIHFSLLHFYDFATMHYSAVIV